MEIEEDSLQTKIVHILRHYQAECLFLFIAITGVIISFWFFMAAYKVEPEPKIQMKKNEKKEEILEDKKPVDERIFIDISGAVNRPGLYELLSGARLKDALDKAKGLSPEADSLFFYRNYNLARQLVDQEKIYVPSLAEIAAGVCVEGRYSIGEGALSAEDSADSLESGLSTGKVNVNTASQSEIESLPGIGPVTANKIMQSRPISKLEELLTKKVLGEKGFDAIKELIEI